MNNLQPVATGFSLLCRNNSPECCWRLAKVAGTLSPQSKPSFGWDAGAVAPPCPSSFRPPYLQFSFLFLHHSFLAQLLREAILSLSSFSGESFASITLRATSVLPADWAAGPLVLWLQVVCGNANYLFICQTSKAGLHLHDKSTQSDVGGVFLTDTSALSGLSVSLSFVCVLFGL